jgi:O-antigen ligase
MRQEGLPSPQYILMLGFWFTIVMSFLSRFMLRSTFNAFLDFAAVAIFYFLVLTNAFTTRRVRIICTAVVLCAVVMSIQGMFAYHAGYMAAKLLSVQLSTGFEVVKRVRAFGILSDPNDFAQFLLVALSLLGIYWKRRNLVANLIFPGLPALVLLYGVFLTGSRGGMLGLLVIVLALAAPRLGKLPSLVLTGFCFLVLIAAQFGGGRQLSIHEGSASERVLTWGTGISFLKSNPLFGIGFGQFTEENYLTAHNSFVLCFSELGMFGYFFWLALLVATLMALHRLIAAPVKTPEQETLRQYAVTVRTALYCFLTTAWFLSRTYNVTLYVLLALAAAMCYQRRELFAGPGTQPIRWVRWTFAVEALSIVVIYVTIRLRTF